MKIVISAFECNPYKGSEAGLGWSWAYAAMKNEQISEAWVVTTTVNKTVDNKDNIDAFLKQNKDDSWKKINFIFVKIPLYDVRINNRFRYIFWQKKIVSVIQQICDNNCIEYVHHVTWASMVLPVYLADIKNSKVLYGPVGGGERIPDSVDISLSKRDWFVEKIRNLLYDISMLYPVNRRIKEKAYRIFVTTEETLSTIPVRYREKTRVMQSIGVYSRDIVSDTDIVKKKNTQEFTVLMAGRFLSWKAIDIGIKAVKRLVAEGEKVNLIICGDGRQATYLKELAKCCKNIRFKGNVSHTQMNDIYDQADLFLNCSLHDSGGMVVLEAMSRGVPIMYIDCGGPAVLAKDAGFVIEAQIIGIMLDEIVTKIKELSRNRSICVEYSHKSLRRVAECYSNERKYEKLFNSI